MTKAVKHRTLPSTLTAQSAHGDRPVKVVELSPVDVPDGDPYTRNGGDLLYPSRWDGHTGPGLENHLRTWTTPERVREIQERVEQAVEEGIPDQRRAIRRNVDDGFFDDRFITEIATGEDVENPCWRWSKTKSDTVRVAICLDAATRVTLQPEVLEARMAVAAGLGAALETAGYEVSIVGACLMAPDYLGEPQPDARVWLDRKIAPPFFLASVVKAEHEPFVGSAFAGFSNTGVRRMINCWVRDGDGKNTQMTDREWRELTGADLFVYVGAGAVGFAGVQFSKGLPPGSDIGPAGRDAIRLQVHGPEDIDTAVEALVRFFRERNDGND